MRVKFFFILWYFLVLSLLDFVFLMWSEEELGGFGVRGEEDWDIDIVFCEYGLIYLVFGGVVFGCWIWILVLVWVVFFIFFWFVVNGFGVIILSFVYVFVFFFGNRIKLLELYGWMLLLFLVLFVNSLCL